MTALTFRPCPFCKSKHMAMQPSNNGGFRVACPQCLAMGPLEHSEVQACISWNAGRSRKARRMKHRIDLHAGPGQAHDILCGSLLEAIAIVAILRPGSTYSQDRDYYPPMHRVWNPEHEEIGSIHGVLP